ncbi:glycosyltransferase family 2 protein [Streptomyces sp. NPDC020845]|uniref:glycosyltransferase family 2 protein n=1 Tax=Streptomyces sp. NPDC020845 TaxID=3365096 RepID=UPI00379B2440
MRNPRVGVAILTMGTRPAELTALLASVAKQDTPAARVVVVGNGSPLPLLPDGVTGVELPENLGISGGRNAALARLKEFGDVDVVVDLDDDGLLISTDVFTRLVELYESDPRLGIVSFRIADERGRTQRRHVPRLRSSDPMRGGLVTTFLGGGHGLSMRMLEEIGGWPEPFFYAHEETDLSWRALDAGWKVLYEPDLVLQHPWTSPTRHAVFYRMVARNRVWLAKRHLPALLVPVYLGTWTALTMARTRSAAGLRAWFGGFVEGLRTPCPPRRPMRWATVWRMTRLGRPPVI